MTSSLEIFDARLRVGRVLGLEELDVLGAVDEEFEQLGGGNLLCGLGLVGAFSRECGGLFCECAGQKSGDPGVEAGCVPVCGVGELAGVEAVIGVAELEAVLEVGRGFRRLRGRGLRDGGGRCWSRRGRAGGGGVHAFGKAAVNQGARIENQVAEGGQGGAGAGRQQAPLDNLLQGSPEREIGFQSDPLDGFHGGLADAADRGVDHAHEGDGVVGIQNELEVGDHVLDLGALIEAEASDDVVVEVVAAQSFFQQARLGVGAIEDGALVFRALAGARLRPAAMKSAANSASFSPSGAS